MQGIHKKERESRKRKTLLTDTGLLMEGVILTRHALEGIAWNWVLKISHHEYVEVKASLYFLFRGMKDSPQPKPVGSPQA
jgi:hypothetical protein